MCGYGHVGKGIARNAAGLGGNVIITEIDPIAALKAKLDGYSVLPMLSAAAVGDLFVTTTGCKDVIREEHFLNMKNGSILANAGHFNVEISVDALKSNSKLVKQIKENTTEY